jgi:hypothetical protein
MTQLTPNCANIKVYKPHEWLGGIDTPEAREERQLRSSLRGMVAKYLYQEGSGVPPAERQLLIAAGRVLLGEDVGDKALLDAARRCDLDDDPLYFRPSDEPRLDRFYLLHRASDEAFQKLCKTVELLGLVAKLNLLVAGKQRAAK